jgi:Flp pilus assembly protein TadD
VLGEAEFQRAARGWVEDAAASVLTAEGLARQVLASVDTRAHARAHALLALILNHQGNYRLAMAQADRALALNPSDPGVLYQRAAASLSLGQVDEAIRLHETARRFEPRPLTGERLSLGLALFTAGRYADAVAETELLLTSVPDHAHAQALKAAALARSGRVEEARLVAEAVKRSDPLFDADSFGTRFEDPTHTALLRASLRAAGL